MHASWIEEDGGERVKVLLFKRCLKARCVRQIIFVLS
jgi:hypothetical protein